MPAAELPARMRHDSLGDSYVFWLPYEPKAKVQLLLQAKITVAGKDAAMTSVHTALEPAAEAVANAAGRLKTKQSQRAVAKQIPRAASPTAPAAN